MALLGPAPATTMQAYLKLNFLQARLLPSKQKWLPWHQPRRSPEATSYRHHRC